jgi:putative salt-induced outer membrane protein YdiY
MPRNRICAVMGVGVFTAIAAFRASPLSAQDEPPPPGWYDKAEVTFVMTSGNSTSSTLGLKNTLDRRWERALLRLSAGAIRAESGVTTRTATGTVDDFQVVRTTTTQKTAERYFVEGRYDRDVTESAFLFGGAGWDRNTFAGIQNRYAFIAGVGEAWIDREARRLKTDLGLTYTIQDDVVEDPRAQDSFGGLRANLEFFQTLTPTTDFQSVLVVDQNLKDSPDRRADWTNSVAVAVSDNLALKTSVQILYDNQPALVSVPLGDERVNVPLQKSDRTFTVALVIDF